jgi:hypothetical protein
MSKHTLKNWHVEDGWDEGSPSLLIKRGYSEIIALLPNYDDSNAPANARLIAEAPAMAEALEGLLSAANPADADSISLQVWDNRLKAASVSARAILARINGGTP